MFCVMFKLMNMMWGLKNIIDVKKLLNRSWISNRKYGLERMMGSMEKQEKISRFHFVSAEVTFLRHSLCFV